MSKYKKLIIICICIGCIYCWILTISQNQWELLSTVQLDSTHNPTSSPLQLPLFPIVQSPNQTFTKVFANNSTNVEIINGNASTLDAFVQILTTTDVFTHPMEYFPDFTEMQKLLAIYSQPSNVQKNMQVIDRSSSALDVYLNIVRPAQAKWFEFITEKGIRSAEGNTATDVKYGQNILFIKTVQDILQYKSFAKICEIGFNMGHSALTWLIADYPLNRTKYLGFSFNHVNQQMCAHELQIFLNLKERKIPVQPKSSHSKTDVFEIIWGDSTSTVPAFTNIVIANNTSDMEKCDIVFVDGGHHRKVPWTDLLNMRKLVDLQNHYLFMDDTCTSSRSNYCRVPLKAWKNAIADNIVTQYLCWETKRKARGFCMGKYN